MVIDVPAPSLFETPRTGLATSATQEPPAEHRAEARLQMGDATDPQTLPCESVDLVVTSPPYNLEKPYSQETASDNLSYESYAAFSRSWLRNCYDWTRPTGRLCVNVPMDTNKNGKRPLAADVTCLGDGGRMEVPRDDSLERGQYLPPDRMGQLEVRQCTSRHRSRRSDYRPLQRRMEAPEARR